MLGRTSEYPYRTQTVIALGLIFVCVTIVIFSSSISISHHIFRFNDKSSCSEEATKFGPGQKVIAFSFFDGKRNDILKSPYLKGIKKNVMAASELYPEWLVRVYTNPEGIELLKNLTKNYDSLHLCNVQNIPGIGNVENMYGSLWRFLVLGDALVDIFVSRDADSLISKRERKAVNEWENSEYALHSMRDHPLHFAELMGGMWGANNKILGRKLAKILQQQIFMEGKAAGTSAHKDIDQRIIAEVIYFHFYKNVLAHDAYHCRSYPDGDIRPFPTKRDVNNTFVGKVDDGLISPPLPCPFICRPEYGKNWTYC